MPIQFILVIIIILAVLRLLYQLKNKNIGLSQFFMWLVIWLIAIVIIWQPKITTYLAALVGIGRGVDLAIYISIIVIFYLMFRLLIRIEKIEKDITKIVRSEALKNNKEHD
ncbi:MAG: DUF2304 family protein [Candidatus Buchananbacteria bacterium]|nr:DUF2304 family protein [Candidatus Buchananbacteria bacterium]